MSVPDGVVGAVPLPSFSLHTAWWSKLQDGTPVQLAGAAFQLAVSAWDFLPVFATAWKPGDHVLEKQVVAAAVGTVT